jgi:hypothetical protein
MRLFLFNPATRDHLIDFKRSVPIDIEKAYRCIGKYLVFYHLFFSRPALSFSSAAFAS